MLSPELINSRACFSKADELKQPLQFYLKGRKKITLLQPGGTKIVTLGLFEELKDKIYAVNPRF
jgi:hypothetical protein